MNRPTIRQLEYLIALDNEKSFIRAADACNVTQSTLSAGIKELESILDQKLVTRGRKTTTLTAFGIETVTQAHKILADVDKIAARAQQIKAPLSGPLRFGTIPTIAPYFLPQVLPKIQKEFPALELHLHEDITERIVQKLMQGKLDIVLIAFPYETPGMTQMFLFEEPFYLACPKGREPEGKNITTGDLDPGELLLLDEGHCLSDHALDACGLQRPAQRKAYSATSLPTLIQMVNNNFGMTLLPEMTVNAYNVPPNISVMRFKAPEPMRQIGLAWRSGHPRRNEFEMLGNALKTP